MEGHSPSDPVARLAASATSGARVRLRVGVGACVALGVLALVIAVFVAAVSQQGFSHGVDRGSQPDDEAVGRLTMSTEGEQSDPAAGDIVFVHVLGAVISPGLYQLRVGDRVVDVVAAAGGFADTADPAGVNLARHVSDGEQLYVPEVGEVPEPVAGRGSAQGADTVQDGKVNLNTATSIELEALPRVGPAMAQRIVDWRETNGRFTSIEDLMSITGIGEKTFESLKDLVTV